MNITINNEAILLNQQIMWAERDLANTEAMLKEKLDRIERYGLPMNPSSCLAANRQLQQLRKSIKEQKADLAELPSFVSL
jgi:hypothetical protein